MKPITPSEVQASSINQIPDQIIEVFNELINEKFGNNRAYVHQSLVDSRLTKLGFNMREVYDKGWLNVEKLYRDSGWLVTYNKPDWNETGDPCWTFEVKK